MSVMEPTIRHQVSIRPSVSAEPETQLKSELPAILVIASDMAALESRLGSDHRVVHARNMDDIDDLGSARPLAVFYNLDVRDDVVEAVRAVRRRFDCPVFITSGYRDPRTVADAFRAGAQDVFGDSVPVEVEPKVRLAAERCRQMRRGQEEANEIRARVDSLSTREREVMGLLAEGLSIKQIASRCEISFQTAAKHRANVLRKMRAENDVRL
ncbi:MAG: LuxR C-terminal-related transcriptional regulator, partial [Pirellulaceae bacterium]|nr:LuxR C-terminal-related transcriptional regulator [Pirellulaceae bacterium]